MAEAVFQKMVDEAGLSDKILVDSAGTGSWHVGQSADGRTRRVLAKHGIDYTGSARRVTNSDVIGESTYIIAMDTSNISDIIARFGRLPRMYKLLEFASDTDLDDIPDPYYNLNFEEVYHLVIDGCRGLLARIREEENL